MRLSRKTEEYLQPALAYLENQGIACRVERNIKRVTVRASVNGHPVTWYASYTMSDHRAGLHFEAQVRRAVERFRQLEKGASP